MSSASVGLGSSLAQYFASLRTSDSSATPQVDGTTATSGTSSASGTSGTLQVSGHHHHHHGGGGGDGGETFSKIQQAVTDALNSSQSDPNADPNQVIEDAIAKVVGSNGSTSASGATQQTDADGDQSGSVAGANDSSNRQAFFDMLKSHGIDASQFRQDLMSAMQQARGGNNDPSIAFQSLPPGTAVDATA